MDGLTRNRIEVIGGCMFCGKTEELIRRLIRAQIAKQTVRVFKPIIDDRYSKKHIVSHSKAKFPSTLVSKASEILKQVAGVQVIGIDEAQFFGRDLVGVCERLVSQGIRVIIAGLDQDYRGKPFGPMPQIFAIADDVTKLSAVCVKCGAPATKTQRLTANHEQVLVGAANIYEARCRSCHEIIT